MKEQAKCQGCENGVAQEGDFLCETCREEFNTWRARRHKRPTKTVKKMSAKCPCCSFRFQYTERQRNKGKMRCPNPTNCGIDLFWNKTYGWAEYEGEGVGE